MIRRWLRSWKTLLFAGTLAIFTASLVFAASRLAMVERSMREDISENMLWHVSQTQFEMARFADALHRFAADDLSPDSLTERYEIATSRMLTLADGLPRERLESYGGVAARLPEAAAALDGLAPVMADIAAGNKAELPAILAIVDPLVFDLRDAANSTLVGEQERAVTHRDERRRANLDLLLSFLGIIASGACFAWSLWSELRRSRMLGMHATAAEAAARQSEERFRDVVDAASDWIWETDAEHRFTFLSHRLQQLSGEKPMEIIGKNRFDLYAADDETGLWARHRQDLDARRQFRDFIFPHHDAGQQLRYARVHGKPTFAPDGTFLGYRGTGRDITPEIESARALEDNRRLLRTVVDAVPAIINVKGADGRYVFINRHQGQIFGIDPQKAVGLTTLEVLGEELTPYYAELDQHVIESGQAVPFTERTFGVTARRPAPTTWLYSKQPIKDTDGRTRYIVTVALDISELKRAERARANLSRHFSPNMVEELIGMDSPFGLLRSQNVAALFVDMVGFTEMCIELPAEEAFNVLRDYHARMSGVVLAFDGTLDKYIGDSIMATFGTPKTGPRDATNALRCAREMLRVIDAWNAERMAAGQFTVDAGIGVHYGPALLGLVGDERRVEFAVIGDTINVASRLEDLTRVRGIHLVASEEFIAAVIRENVATTADLAGLAPAGREILRGRRTSTAIWTMTASARAELSRGLLAAD